MWFDKVSSDEGEIEDEQVDVQQVNYREDQSARLAKMKDGQ